MLNIILFMQWMYIARNSWKSNRISKNKNLYMFRIHQAIIVFALIWFDKSNIEICIFIVTVKKDSGVAKRYWSNQYLRVFLLLNLKTVIEMFWVLLFISKRFIKFFLEIILYANSVCVHIAYILIKLLYSLWFISKDEG